jgi:predicted MFS family arabinose efflux permease
MREGLSFVLRHSLLRPIVVSAALSNLFVMAFIAVQPIFYVRTLGVDAGAYGSVLAAAAIGGVLGAMTTTVQARLFGQARMLWLNVVVSGCFFLLIPLAEAGPRLALAVVGGFGDSFFIAALGVAEVSFRQGLCPPELLGRVNATARFLNWGVMPAGGLLGGVLAQTIGVRESIWVFGFGLIAAALPVLASPLRRMRDMPTA